MTELELVETLRSDPAPTAAVIDRHRAQLRNAVRSHGVAPQVDGTEPAPETLVAIRPAQHPGRWPRFAAAAVVVVALGVTALVAAQQEGDRAVVAGDGRRVTAPAPSSSEPATPTTAAPVPPACGTTLPAHVVVPAGFGDAVPGVSPDAPFPAAAGQYVVHWLSASGSIEVRWPADAGRWPTGDGSAPAPGDGIALSEDAPAVSAAGRTFVVDTLVFPDQAIPACATMQVSVFDDDPGTVTRINEGLVQDMFGGDADLVVSSFPADAVPAVDTCRAPAGIDPHPNRGGPVSGLGTFVDPADALLDFVESQGEPGSPVAEPTLVRRGYTEITLPDGSIAYTSFPDPGGDFVATVIHVVLAEGGWTVAEWRATGCQGRPEPLFRRAHVARRATLARQFGRLERARGGT